MLYLLYPYIYLEYIYMFTVKVEISNLITVVTVILFYVLQFIAETCSLVQ
jgi:hypothetical protein